MAIKIDKKIVDYSVRSRDPIQALADRLPEERRVGAAGLVATSIHLVPFVN